MKKLLLMLLVLTGGVSTASAAKLYVNVDNISWWFNDDALFDMYSWEEANQATNHTDWDDHTTNIISPTYMYGGRWYIYEMPAGHDRAIVRRYANSTVANQTYDITVTDDYYIYLVDKNESKLGWDVVSAPEWTGMCVRSSVDGYDGYTNNMVISNNNNTFTKTYTKSEFGSATYFYFRLKHVENVKFAEDGTNPNTWTQIGPTSNDTEMTLPSTEKLQNQFGDGTYNNWKITLPSFDFEKIVITANYITEDGVYKWEVSADAYITKTVDGEKQYATLGCSVPLEIIESNDVTAYPLTANASTGKITKGSAFTTIPGGEGALLENLTESDKTIRAKVLASAAASASNDLVATTGTHVDQVVNDGYTNYILAEEEGVVGFYMVNNTSGNNMLANTAYLKVSDASGVRTFYAFEDETTGIDAVKQVKKTDGQYFNLAGQRVAQPNKGLYIVNGKKLIVK